MYKISSTSGESQRGRVLLIYTGGTIGMDRNDQTGALQPLRFDKLVSRVPELQRVAADVDTYQFDPPIDSSDMQPTLWAKLVELISQRYDQYDGFVILHGTDTMAYTASALSFMLENLTKPVILTGSQLPINQLRTDGKENLLTSIEIATARYRSGRAIVPEVCIYFHGALLRGNRTTKQAADAFAAFESFNYRHLADVGVSITYHNGHILTPYFDRPIRPHFAMDSNVVVFTLFPGISEENVRHMLAAPSLRGIVMRTFGSGNAPQQPWLIDAISEATRRGIVVVNVSQCMAGRVEMSRYDAGLRLQQVGVVSGKDSTVESAITKLMHLQAHYADPEQVRTMMERSIRGEISF